MLAEYVHYRVRMRNYFNTLIVWASSQRTLFSLLSFAFLCLSLLTIEPAFSQVEAPTNQFLFREDSSAEQARRDNQVKTITRADAIPSGDVDFTAEQAEYLKESKKIKGSGGVILSSAGSQVQADTGVFDTETKLAELSGNVLFTTSEGTLQSSAADVDLESELGSFLDADFTLEQGLYQVQCEKAEKLGETQYTLEESELSTCDCEDDTLPWCIKSSRANITQEGYAHTYNTRVEMWGLPVFYTPWMAFPVKQERASGLLAPTYGYTNQDGIRFQQPIFMVLDDYSDLTLNPIIFSRSRNGASLDYRNAFSRYHYLESRFYYLNERPRDGDLRGTNVDNMFDPTFDEDRTAVYLADSWQADPETGLNLGMITDIHYVSDDLFIREINDSDIAEQNARFTTSRATLRSALGDYAFFEGFGEYNQSMLTDDDLILQRLPQMNFTAARSFRPFGFNPYGFRVTPKMQMTATDFARDTGYDGWRYDLNPSLKIPVNYKNFVATELEMAYRQTYYALDETLDPTTGQELEANQDRGISTFSYQASTILERVYDLPQENWLSWITSVGAESQNARLERVKHTIEPTVKFQYVPEVDQESLPFFDSIDRFRPRSLVTYGMVTRLFGRFDNKGAALAPIPELSRDVLELPELQTDAALPDIGSSSSFGRINDLFSAQTGNIRELANISLLQSFDFDEDKEDRDPAREALSDLGLGFGLFPTGYFGFQFNSNLNVEEQQFSQWGFGTHLKDDRGDVFRARYNYIEENLSQVSANLELKLTERIKFGIFSRFDDLGGEFLENTAALRLISKCQCWSLDLGFTDQINPNREQILMKFTFRGLGDITQGIGFDDLFNRQTNSPN